MSEITSSSPEQEAQGAISTHKVDCCIVGAGPAGAMLALLLARKGISVMLLEKQMDLDRKFRGDSVHPSTMNILDQLGLAEKVLQLRHTKVDHVTFPLPDGTTSTVDIGHVLKKAGSRYPYMIMLPQVLFLEFLTNEASRYANFHLVLGARVEELVEENGQIQGIRYRLHESGHDSKHEVRALLTVGADGRFSRMRQLAGFTPIKTSPPMDVLWYDIPRYPGDPEDLQANIKNGHIAILLNHFDHWQGGYVIPKGSYQQFHAAGLEALQSSLADMLPLLADRVHCLQSWQQISLLSVESSRLPCWHRPGLLLIGDAAHVMSPVAGVGINYAIQDTVVAANILSQPLKEGQMSDDLLARVQRRRELPTRLIQGLQAQMQKRIVQNALQSGEVFHAPLILRVLASISLTKTLLVRFVMLGLWPVHLKD
ncbi:FAD-dependent oxidoreductase [Ktedonosporobacter rubrisoli]|uniref:FAD-dependent oxidoreductase n=1 Tax=Ktedonosporobacter rubrisoli TaxID=2509675 RepID=A0A4P6JRV9_KTERU|nr:FAD-dependent oxidoreductase [Ktedonosporobacter rubrisoli]QBD78104.1 FAD-dependent oxidoreductase [Ktedonosporobacter rubrisoli]